MLAQLGLRSPRERYQQLLSYLDGVIFHQLTFPDNAFDPTAGFRTILDDRPRLKPPPTA